MWWLKVWFSENCSSQNMTTALLCVSFLCVWHAFISSVGIWLFHILNSSHLPPLRLASAWLRGNSVVVSPLLTVAVSLSCLVALVTVDLCVSTMFSRSLLRDSGALSRLSADGWIADGNPTAFISGHVSPVTSSSFDGAEVTSILHRGSPVVGLSIPVWVWPVCRCSLIDFLENVSAVSKCILSCLPGVISLAPFFSFSVVNICRLYFRCRLEVKLN